MTMKEFSLSSHFSEGIVWLGLIRVNTIQEHKSPFDFKECHHMNISKGLEFISWLPVL